MVHVLRDGQVAPKHRTVPMLGPDDRMTDPVVAALTLGAKAREETNKIIAVVVIVAAIRATPTFLFRNRPSKSDFFPTRPRDMRYS
jgi:hypothetical protein